MPTKEISSDDPRWKIKEAFARFIRERFTDKFFIVEDLKWGPFTFVVRSNPQVEAMVNEVDQIELKEKLEHFLSYEKISPEKIKMQFLDNDQPQAPPGDKIFRFDILE